ncbi:MAG: isopenicillin N synthase family oxygenase [Rhodobacteraceae bacterium]|nr:isopenicillin N synthase family oxygenase [Paracoccaceae bacterium]
MTEIAQIDISALGGPDHNACVDQIATACRDIGFLTVTGTDVPLEVIDAMRAAALQVFDTDEIAKHRQAITRDNYRGYIPFGFFTPNDGSGTPDLYEGYKLHHETDADDPIRAECQLYGPNLWPEHEPEVADAILTYWRALDDVALRLLGALAEGLSLPPTALQDPFAQPLTNMTLLHYPPQGAQDGFGIHPHKDTCALTLISPDPVGGLEVLTKTGDWITATAPRGGFVVNIGDMLELWSGGRYVSTPHRVINRSGAERYSFPYFAVPRHDVVVHPLVPTLPGFDRPEVHCGHWSAETWRTNWPDEAADEDTPELGTLHV